MHSPIAKVSHATVLVWAVTGFASLAHAPAQAGSISNGVPDYFSHRCEKRDFTCSSSADAAFVVNNCHATYTTLLSPTVCMHQTCHRWSILGNLPTVQAGATDMRVRLTGTEHGVPFSAFPAGYRPSTPTPYFLHSDAYPVRYHKVKDTMCRWHRWCNSDGSGVRSTMETAASSLTGLEKEELTDLCRFSKAWLEGNSRLECVVRHNADLGAFCSSP